MTSQIKLGDIPIDVLRKDIKNVNLSVYPPTGRVRISAPKRMNLDTIRVFAISKLDWIRKQEIASKWYRGLIRDAVPPLLDHWEPKIGVKLDRFFVQHMKTKWGGCNHAKRTIRLNTELAKKPRECLEYIVVHELVHLLEPTHNERFQALMDRFMPNWKHHRQALNRLPVRREDWIY